MSTTSKIFNHRPADRDASMDANWKATKTNRFLLLRLKSASWPDYASDSQIICRLFRYLLIPQFPIKTLSAVGSKRLNRKSVEHVSEPDLRVKFCSISFLPGQNVKCRAYYRAHHRACCGWKIFIESPNVSSAIIAAIIVAITSDVCKSSRHGLWGGWL